MTLKEQALAYCARGWSVIPAQPKGKKPLIGWAPFQQGRADETQITKWWTQWPEANIALITGRVSGLVAVDIDPERGGRHESILASYPTGHINRTGSGGHHLFYKYPQEVSDVPNRVGANGVDIRADGGYVIMPPSTHPNGRLYEVVEDGPAGEVPPWVLNDTRQVNQGQNHWLSDALSGVSPGSRNDTTARLAGYFASKGMAADVALTLLRQWNTNNTPPLSSNELETTLHSVYKTAQRRNQQTQHTQNPFQLIGLNDFMVRWGDAQVSWDIEEWLPNKTIAFIISPPGSYKTWLTYDLAISIAGGKDFLNKYAVKNTGPVILIQQEDYHGQTAERIATIVAAKYRISAPFIREDEIVVPELPNLPIHLHTERQLRFSDSSVLQALEDQIARIKPRLVIIDPLYAAASTDDYMAKTTEQMLVLKGMRDKYGTSFAIVHHTKKTAEGSQREGLWGSQFLNAFLETGWQIRRLGDSDEGVSVTRHFKMGAKAEPLRLDFDISTATPCKYEVDVESLGDVVSTEKVDVQALLRQHGNLTTKELVALTKVDRATIFRHVAKLLKAGLIQKAGNKLKLVDSPTF